MESKNTTNADIIRDMTDEQLALAIMCPNEIGMAEIECDRSDDKNCYKCTLDWLGLETDGRLRYERIRKKITESYF